MFLATQKDLEHNLQGVLEFASILARNPSTYRNFKNQKAEIHSVTLQNWHILDTYEKMQEVPGKASSLRFANYSSPSIAKYEFRASPYNLY